MNTLFVVILRYLVDIKIIEKTRKEHISFLEGLYAKKIIITSGAQLPKTGGVIIARGETREVLFEILKKDPFFIKNFAEYQIYEFIPRKWISEFDNIMNL